MTHFVLTFDRDTQNSDILDFEDANDAFRVFSRRERDLLGDSRFEVVMLSGGSIDEVRITHPNFFEHGDLLPL